MPHKLANTPAWISWNCMRQRCLCPKKDGYKYWGGRGVTVCDRWKHFDNFLSDMGERPLGTTLDRKDNNGNYEPGNCRWATSTEQNRNNRGNRLIEHAGQRKTVTEWADERGVNRMRLFNYLRRHEFAYALELAARTQ